VLAEFERRHLSGGSIGDHFDLIAGTSTGGIIALGLASGLPASFVRDLYIEHGSEIFPPVGKRLRKMREAFRFLRSLRHYQYEREPLEKLLRKTFGRKLIGDADRRLCIPSFDGFTEVNVFKTPHHPDFKMDWREEMVTVALATSAAPTFFSVYRNGNRQFADGGVWANNPIMIALIDALTCYELGRSQIDILSLGCGESEIYITEKQVRLGGVWHWKEIISAAMHLASQNAMGQAGLLIGRDRLVRIDAPPKPGAAIGLDDVEQSVAELPRLAVELADQFDAVVAERFLRRPAEPFRAFHGPRAQDARPEPM
jgi:patatin-like phospholipase/acyl hydrolase